MKITSTAILSISALASGFLLGYLIFKTSDCDECIQDVRCIPPQMAKVCSIDPPKHTYSEALSSNGKILKITTNGIPDHKIGLFPIYVDPKIGDAKGCGRPNEIIDKGTKEFYLPTSPRFSATITWDILNQDFGIANNGVRFDPLAAEYWKDISCDGGDPASLNCWMKNAPLNPDMASDLDCNMGHVQPPDGDYHYHALPTGLYESLGGTYPWNYKSSEEPGVLVLAPIQLGWAWDGCPVYGPTCYQPRTSSVHANWWKPTSGWTLKTGSRLSGEPPGDYNGDFHHDYEYTAGDLDECNGHTAAISKNTQATYHYHITEEYPYIPRCWKYVPQFDDDKQAERKREGDANWNPVIKMLVDTNAVDSNVFSIPR